MKFNDIKNNIIVTSTTKIKLSDLPDLIRAKKVNITKGFSLSNWKNGIIHLKNFESSDALTFDFYDHTNQNEIEDKLKKLNIKYLIINSKSSGVTKNSTQCIRFHIILPLKTSIESAKEHIRMMHELNRQLFYSKAKELLFTPTSFLYYSRKGAKSFLNNTNGLQYIDEIDLQAKLYDDVSRSFEPLREVKFHKKLRRNGEEFYSYKFDDSNIEYIDFSDKITPITKVRKEPQRIICPFHNNEVAHEAEIQLIKNKVEIFCNEHNQIFTPIIEFPRSAEEGIEETEIFDLESKGFIIGMLNDHDGTYFIYNKRKNNLDTYKESAFKNIINIMYKKFYPKATMSGTSYYYRMKRHRNIYRITYNPKFWEAEGFSRFESYINLAKISKFPTDSDQISTILKSLNKYGWQDTMHRFLPFTTLLLQNIMGEGFKTSALQYFLNWLAGVIVYREKAKTALIFNGHPRNGVYALREYILRPLLDSQNFETVPASQVLEKFNDFIVGKSLVLIEGTVRTDGESFQVVSRIENWVNNPTLTVNKKLQAQYKTENNTNFIWFTTRGLPTGFSTNDSIFSVFRGFTKLNSLKAGNRNIEESDIFSKISIELHSFNIFLKLWDFDPLLFDIPYANEHRKILLDRTGNHIWETLSTITDPNFAYQNIKNTTSDVNELQTLLVEAFSTKTIPYIPLNLLTILHNQLHQELLTAKKVSLEIRNLLGINKTDRQRFGYEKKITAGFFLNELQKGMKRAEGTLNEKLRRTYLPLSSAAYRDSVSKKLLRNSLPQLSQTIEDFHQLFTERPLYQIKDGKITIRDDKESVEANFSIIVNHRDDNIITDGDKKRMNIHYTEFGDQDTENFLPLEERKYLNHRMVNQFFSPGEIDALLDYLNTHFNLALSKTPVRDIIVEETGGSMNAVKYKLKLDQASERWMTELDLAIYLFIPDNFNLRNVNIIAPLFRPSSELPDSEIVLVNREILYR